MALIKCEMEGRVHKMLEDRLHTWQERVVRYECSGPATHEYRLSGGDRWIPRCTTHTSWLNQRLPIRKLPSCSHQRYGETDHCTEPVCPNYHESK